MAWFWCKEKYLLFKRRAWPFWEGIVEMRCRDGSWQVSVRSFRAGRCSPLASTSNEVGAPLVARRKPRLPARYWLVRSYVIPPSRLVRPCRWAPEGSTRRPLVENDVFGPAAWFSRVGGPPKEALGGHQQSWRSLRARGRQRQSVPVRTSWRSCRWTRCVFAGGASSVAITCVSSSSSRAFLHVGSYSCRRTKCRAAPVWKPRFGVGGCANACQHAMPTSGPPRRWLWVAGAATPPLLTPATPCDPPRWNMCTRIRPSRRPRRHTRYVALCRRFLFFLFLFGFLPLASLPETAGETRWNVHSPSSPTIYRIVPSFFICSLWSLLFYPPVTGWKAIQPFSDRYRVSPRFFCLATASRQVFGRWCGYS